jgi:hypothetical protein
MKLSLLAAFLVIAGVGLWIFLRSDSEMNEALQLRKIATRELARHLSTNQPDARILVIGNPFTQRRGQPREIVAFEKAGLRGIREGWSGSAVTVVYPELRPEFLKEPASVYVDPNTVTPLSFLVDEGALDQLTRANPGCNLLVSLIGLPVNLLQTKAWRDPETPRFALLLPDWRMVGSAEEIIHAVKSGKIVAAVVNRPRASADRSPKTGESSAEEFHRNFLLVTPSNVEHLIRTSPQVFSPFKN